MEFSLIVLKDCLLDFNWYRAVTQCTYSARRPYIANVLMAKLRIKIVRTGIPYRHSYSCGQTVGWIKMPLSKEVGLDPGHIVLYGIHWRPRPHSSPCPLRPMSIVAKLRSPISATAELLLYNDTSQQTFRPLLSKLSKRRQIEVFCPHFEEVRGGVEPWLIARWKARVEFLLRN